MAGTVSRGGESETVLVRINLGYAKNGGALMPLWSALSNLAHVLESEELGRMQEHDLSLGKRHLQNRQA